MTDGPLEFSLARNTNPASDEVRADILADPGFGRFHTDHMVSIDYLEGRGWHDAAVLPYGPIELDPSAIVLHYAQEVFEGLKAYRWADGSIVSFRPEANAARLRSSAHRLAIPELPEQVFIESLRQLIAVDGDWVPAAGGEESLYLRPFIFATEPGLGVRPANEYRYLVIGSPAGAYFKGGIKPRRVWLSTEYVRASPGGTGAAKFGGNYAASLLAQAEATDHGCDQVVWLDAIERRYIEEMGGMNLFFVFGSGGSARLVTPELRARCCPVSRETRCCSWQLMPDTQSRSARSTSTNGRRRWPPARSPRCSPAAPRPSSRRCRWSSSATASSPSPTANPARSRWRCATR